MIKDYQIVSQIYESENSLVYRAIWQKNQQSQILKVLKQDHPSANELTKYRQEYHITNSLQGENIIKTYGLRSHENTLIILLEDFGGESLTSLLPKHQFSFTEFLSIAIKITQGLEVIHQANIIHKDINPSNIVYNPTTKQLKIIDFGLSSQLSSEFLSPLYPNQIEGTLAYISPEQTGRINRGLDCRTDFYSLGVTFFELLTHQLPFESEDIVELVYCHIAQKPPSICKIVPEIPDCIGDIVDKLLAKTPEERYQTANGIKADLETCLDELQNTGKVSSFTLGSQDITKKLQIRQKLYGREAQVNQLLNIYETVSQGTSAMALVSGYSGIGKSALVNEIYKPITKHQGQFIRGKFDQLQKNTPYSAISQAFQELIRQLLRESQPVLEFWRQKIIKTLGENAQLIIDIIPELENIIGSQPPVKSLEARESRNRLNLFFQKFVSIFCQSHHPLVIFIDDLQWADLPSLYLIEELIINTDLQSLLIIGAYRDNEVSATHPLIQTVETMVKAEVEVREIHLQPLQIGDVNQLIADTLACDLNTCQPLAELLQEKTGGNPFFLTQLLDSLWKNNLLVFDSAFVSFSESEIKGGWHWDIDKIKSISITDNVVDLMVNKIAQLEPQTQRILQLASCVGNRFNLEMLAIVHNKSIIVTARELQSALDQGLVLPLDENYKIPLLDNLEDLSRLNQLISPSSSVEIGYKFLHDRVQQAAYSLISESEKKQIHLQIGRLLLENTNDEDLNNHLFELVNQLNQGRELITEKREKYHLAQLNLQAGKKANLASAYKPALQYLATGLNLLDISSWQDNYQLTFDLYWEHLNALYLNTEWQQVQQQAEQMIEVTDNILDLAKIYQVLIMSCYGSFQPQKAIDIAINFLQQVGINLSLDNLNTADILPKITQQNKNIEQLLQGKKIEDLAHLPPMSEPEKLAAISVLQPVTNASATTNYPLFVEVVLSQLNLCLQYNNPPSAAITYSLYGVILCGVSKENKMGYRFGKLSLNLLEKNDLTQFESAIVHYFYCNIFHWQEWLNDELIPINIKNSLQKAINLGNHEYVGYLALDYCLIRFLGGYNLAEIDQDYQKYGKLIAKIKQEYSLNYLVICHNIIRNLIEEKAEEEYYCLISENEQIEQEKVNGYIEQQNQWLLFAYYYGQTYVNYYYKNYDQAFCFAQETEKYLPAVLGLFTSPQFTFYSSLIYLKYLQCFSQKESKKVLDKIDKNLEDLQRWADDCPENFENKYYLVCAEKARLENQKWSAQELYEKAISHAKKYKFIHEEAIAYERASEFYFALDREEIATLYLKNAYSCYDRWGAVGKLKQLEQEYSQYLLTITNPKQPQQVKTRTSGETDGKILDLATVIKASQAITEEIKLENLLVKLLKIVIENAGAKKGILVLKNKEKWTIEGQGTIDPENFPVLQSIPLDSVDPNTQIALLPISVINYVANTKKYVVLDNALKKGLFINDPYIIDKEIKSILCIPLINQGKLIGIVYLENSSTTNVFTQDRVKLLNLLSAQTAIAIENSQLYKTLEQRVEERTKELSQTLHVLKATQAELKFENDLLKNPEQPTNFDYQVGGSLSMDAPTYVVRKADRTLYQALKQGLFCYILNSRQMGKSSLMTRMMNHLNHEGHQCVALDLTRIGSQNVTLEQWYKGLAVDLLRNFRLWRKINFKQWWQERSDLSAVQRLGQLLEDVILGEVEPNFTTQYFIFIDEIDCVRGLNFPVDDFFALIRSCYQQQMINPNSPFHHLTFAFFGVATPSDLTVDTRTTPFNIGQAIELESFKIHEAQPLLYGLSEKVNNPQTVLQQVLYWTGGQPFLTQKLCLLIRNTEENIPSNQEAKWIADLVTEKIINNWEEQDQPEHLRTICNRLLKSKNSQKLLSLYRQLLTEKKITFNNSPLEQELRLSGIVVKKDDRLVIHNPIYETIFDANWLEEVTRI